MPLFTLHFSFTQAIHQWFQITPSILIDGRPPWCAPRLHRQRGLQRCAGGAAEHRQQPGVAVGAAGLIRTGGQVEVVVEVQNRFPFALLKNYNTQELQTWGDRFPLALLKKHSRNHRNSRLGLFKNEYKVGRRGKQVEKHEMMEKKSRRLHQLQKTTANDKSSSPGHQRRGLQIFLWPWPLAALLMHTRLPWQRQQVVPRIGRWAMG